MDFLVSAHKVEDRLWSQNITALDSVANFAAEVAALEGGHVEMIEDGFDV